MKQLLEELKNEIEQSNTNEHEKAKLLKLYKELKKRHERLDFQYQRSENDKTISINILKSTVEELTIQKELVLEKTVEINKNLEILQESYEELEQFTKIASHDLKSPLRTIGNYGQLLSKRFGNVLSSEGNEYLKHIIQGVKHMSEIISGLMEYSKIDRNESAEIIDLQDLIHEIALKINLSDNTEGTSIFIPIKEMKIIGHRKDVECLFTELILNAIKYRSQHTPSILINMEKTQQGELLFSVKDNGMGLEEEFQEKAFLPFQRIHHLERPGVGIGLAKCKKSVMMHGGKIWYMKNPNQGTTFYFTIPQLHQN